MTPNHVVTENDLNLIFFANYALPVIVNNKSCDRKLIYNDLMWLNEFSTEFRVGRLLPKCYYLCLFQ